MSSIERKVRSMVIPGYECITEYDEAKHMAQVAREMAQMEKQAEANLKIGEERGEIRAFVRLVKAGLLSVSDAAKFAHMTVSEFESKAELEAR